MNYRMSENYEEEILRLNRRVKELLSYSEKAAADNTQLLHENRDLKVHCNKYHTKYHNLREIHFKNQFRLQELEDSRDALLEANRRQKVNNNKYLDMIRKQNDRIKQMENSMKVQTIRNTGIRTGGDSVELDLLKVENDRLRKECQEVQEALNESYNIIDELEFELETLDFVEADRDHLQQELKDTRAALAELRSSNEPQELFSQFRSMAVGEEEDGTEEASGSIGSGEGEKPAFAAFAMAVTEDGEDVPDHDHEEVDNKPIKPPRGNASTNNAGAGGEESAKANEWKLRRQELHKRLEILHQRQQL